jgi:hypothetical protein
MPKKRTTSIAVMRSWWNCGQLQQVWPQDAAVREQLAKASMIRQPDPNLDVS